MYGGRAHAEVHGGGGQNLLVEAGAAREREHVPQQALSQAR